MEGEHQVKFYFGIIAAMLAFVIITAGFIMVIFRYHKRLLLKQQELLKRDVQHKEELLLTSINSAEAERIQLAKDIHDEIGSIFSTLSLSINQISEHDISGTSHLQVSKKLLQSGIDSVRRISHAIVPFELDLLGLEDTLEHHFDTLSSLSGIRIDFENAISLEALNKQAALALYRIMQELCSNCLKHAHATRISIRISGNGDFIFLKYHDNGKGVKLQNGKTFTGIGLKNIESRGILLGGSVSFISAPGEGFGCDVSIPLKNNLSL
jgi:two-component system NarL family sensor kinase